MIVLWATAQGLELSLYNHTVEPTSGFNDNIQDDSSTKREFFSKPITDAPTPSHQSMKNNLLYQKPPGLAQNKVWRQWLT